MWKNKLLDLIWRLIQIFTTPHEINKPSELNWKKRINICHVSPILKHVTVSFRSMKASRLHLQWMQFPQTFYVWIFNVNLLVFFQEIFVRQKCLVFFCACARVLLVLTWQPVGVKLRGKKCYVYELNSNGANKPVLVSFLCCTDQQCIFMEINTFELSWVSCRMISKIANYIKYNYFWDGDGIENVTLRLWKLSYFCTRHTVGVTGDDILFHILVDSFHVPKRLAANWFLLLSSHTLHLVSGLMFPLHQLTTSGSSNIMVEMLHEGWWL